MQVFKLPDPGEGLVEAEIVTWRVAVGDEVKINDVVVEIETSKSLVELPSPFAGRVAELMVPEGATVDVGSPILAVDDGTGPAGGGSGSAAGGSAGPAEAAEADEAAAPNLVGYGVRAAGTSRRPRRTASPEPVTASAERAQARVDESLDPVVTSAPSPVDERVPLAGGAAEPTGAPLPAPGPAPTEPREQRGPVLAKPPTRLLARQLGVDLTTLTGTGHGGIITRDDVETAARTGAPVPDAAVDAPPAAVAAAEPVGERIPVRGVRKATAEAVVASAFTAPHVTEWVEVDVTASMELLDRVRARRDMAGVRLTPLVLVATAVCQALRRTPELNSRWVDGPDGPEIVRSSEVNLGIAAATPRGLMVPNVKGAQRLRLRELAEALNELVAVAKEGRTQPAALSGGTFTITNVGVFGVDAGTPILNRGEAGILCLGAISRRPWVVGEGAEERIEPRWVTTLSVSFDHRVADGAEGSRFLADVALMLHDPAMGALI
ncbi:2-oxo acid dehydrogenase subunit E2 [Auraticoccus sp. F435]|uniref:Dihydrolipoamide acetyltransferase component of pyruvate dehydrogenase complex n=1 Tax=Auraticoccus cholistanensis TaxID=2656650 RepID=A0A6A9UT74_9ACTN|nr:dihydrolipoamide acetyltransferase family protein [Auraticoccus cholistanensis]MVA74774.1 2-oxo acid dehydrogenase subunit E2 [Auraticoccus cholistanensis]